MSKQCFTFNNSLKLFSALNFVIGGVEAIGLLGTASSATTHQTVIDKKVVFQTGSAHLLMLAQLQQAATNLPDDHPMKQTLARVIAAGDLVFLGYKLLDYIKGSSKEDNFDLFGLGLLGLECATLGYFGWFHKSSQS